MVGVLICRPRMTDNSNGSVTTDFRVPWPDRLKRAHVGNGNHIRKSTCVRVSMPVPKQTLKQVHRR